MNRCERMAPLLDGYHDGELGFLDRWRVERHLAGCPTCRSELAGVGAVGAWVRESVGSPRDPNLWPEIALQLPASPAGAASVRIRSWRVVVPGAAAAVATAAAALLLTWSTVAPAPSSQGVVRSLNTHGRPVMVLDGLKDDPTIIWMMDDGSATQRSSEDAANVWI
jgi:anti-sigma factor RsiW